MNAVVAKLLLLAVGGALAFLAWRSKRMLNVPKVVPVPRTFDEAVGHVENWQHCKGVRVGESTWAADHVPSSGPVRAVRFELPEVPAQGLLERVRPAWEPAGLLLVRARRGLAIRGSGERPAQVLLFDTTDARRVAGHVGPGAGGGATARALDAYLAAVQALQPFRLEEIDEDRLVLAFPEAVARPTELARLTLDLHPELLDPETLDVVEPDTLAEEIARERRITVAWN